MGSLIENSILIDNEEPKEESPPKTPVSEHLIERHRLLRSHAFEIRADTIPEDLPENCFFENVIHQNHSTIMFHFINFLPNIVKIEGNKKQLWYLLP